MPRRAAAACLLAASLAWPAGSGRADGLSTGRQTIAVDGQQRSFVVHVPPHIAHPTPVVLVFHGGGGRPEAIERKAGMDAIADGHGFITVYPEGVTRPSGRGGSWNVGGAFRAVSADDVAFVKAILGDLRRRTAIDDTRIFAAGHSMGGVFAYRLACEMPDTFAAIAAVSASMVEESCHPSAPVAVLHVHGTADARIPVNGGHGAETAAPGRQWPVPREGVAEWARLDGCHGTPAQADEGGAHCTAYTGCRAAVEYCAIAGGTHAWPVEASERVWAFFATHPKTAQ